MLFKLGFSTIQAVYESTTSDSFLLEVTTKSWEAIQGSKNYILFYLKKTQK